VIPHVTYVCILLGVLWCRVLSAIVYIYLEIIHIYTNVLLMNKSRLPIGGFTWRDYEFHGIIL